MNSVAVQECELYQEVPDPSRGEGSKEVTSCWSAAGVEKRGVLR